jgi:hypothetical protein
MCVLRCHNNLCGNGRSIDDQVGCCHSNNIQQLINKRRRIGLMKTRRSTIQGRVRSSGLLLVILACVIQAQPVFSQDPSSQRHPISGTSTRRNDLSRRIQSWMIKQRAIPKTRSLGQNKRNPATASERGSVLTFQKPTKANIGRWFGVDEDPGNIRSMLRREFNHGKHGIEEHPLLDDFCN